MTDEQMGTDLLRKFSPLDGLKRDNLAALARKVQLRELSPGQILFKEGDSEKRTVYVVSGLLELLDDGKVGEIIEGGTDVAANALTFSGIGMYRRALFRDLDPGRIKLAPVLRKAMANKQVSGEHYRGRWLDVGTPQRLAELDNELSNK